MIYVNNLRTRTEYEYITNLLPRGYLYNNIEEPDALSPEYKPQQTLFNNNIIDFVFRINVPTQIGSSVVRFEFTASKVSSA